MPPKLAAPLAGALLGFAVTWTAIAEVPSPPAALVAAVNRPVVLNVAGSPDITPRQDISYADPDYAKFDLYAGLGTSELKPAVIFLSGPAPEPYPARRWGVYRSWGQLTAASGMTAIIPTTRLGHKDASLGDADADVRTLLRFLSQHGHELGIDASNICLFVFSGGAPLAAPYLSGSQTSIKCIAAFYPALSTASDAAGRPRFADALAGSSTTPLLILRAGADRADILQPLDEFVAAAAHHRQTVRVIDNPGAPHGFDNQTDDETTRSILRTTLQFARKQLGLDAAEN